MISNKASQRFCIYFRPRRKFPTTSVHTHCIMPPPSPPDACLNSPGAPSTRSPTTYRARSPAFFDNVWASAPSTRPSAEKRCDKNRLPPQKGSTARRPKNEKVREAQKNGNEPSHDETFPHRTYIEMKKLSQNGKSKWESRIRNLFDYPFDTAKVHTKVESTKYISSFFSYKSRAIIRFFPFARALSIGSSRKNLHIVNHSRTVFYLISQM